MDRGAQVVVDVTAMGQAGDGVAKAPDGRTLFVRGALPGERVRATVTELHSNFVRARRDQVLKASDDRVSPPCPVFGRCGGCTFQHWSYDAELRHKQDRVVQALRRIGGFEAPPVKPVVPAPDPYGYRAKASFAYAGTVDRPVLGFYVAGTHRVVPLAECAIQDDLINDVLAAALPAATGLALAPYQEETGQGLLRHLVVRASRWQRTTAAMVVVSATDPRLAVWAERLMARVPTLAGVAVNVNPDRTNRIEGPVTRTLAGDPVLQEQILGVPFRLAPDAFFQVNPIQVERLYALVLTGMGPERVETAWDLYAGVGTLARLMAGRADQVDAVEMNARAVAEGRHNTAGYPVRFHVGGVEGVLAELLDGGSTPDVAVMDPPRSGVRPVVVAALLEARPRRIVYVSCRPETLARDLRLLSEAYTLRSVEPVDMFPRSDHVESVAVLERRGGAQAV
ncbi:MAG: 23S rRNA (uracil(1939)-C(5))-methyltransferase RlmD [Thermaerobacter sp.]|nr:23S rRNA (uracil(1939)-C(5))-methyltransferase RlmD [Thermaerobacter sp.]